MLATFKLKFLSKTKDELPPRELVPDPQQILSQCVSNYLNEYKTSDAEDDILFPRMAVRRREKKSKL